MRIVDLTMPMWEGMVFNNCYPNESPFTIDYPIPDKPDVGMARYGMCAEPGTRFCAFGAGENAHL